MDSDFITTCKSLIEAFKSGKLGQTIMPEDSHPEFKNQEERLAYFTLPMALNYQRNSYTLWECVLKTYQDAETKKVFDLKFCATAPKKELQKFLTKHKVALQSNKHISTWQVIAKTVYENWGSFSNLFNAADNDFLKLQEIVQKTHKKGFPYLSGPKIFHYWTFIISTYGKIPLKNKQFIDIAPDTHITKCSVLLEVITEQEAETLPKEAISEKWRGLLKGSNIAAIDMHPPLWFWSRNGFIYKL